ncbi:neutral/alkaline non-lysosomal ceramidase N-terminal domain-containing protein [Tessaracoccus lubricantis]|uniref:neutral/alkaline non-lysosomal ceramidase N-terminal domain-containing protein n=1 Tax=Tessaracoccus lubricantis TaxID=545543 RepID=UPI00364529CC
MVGFGAAEISPLSNVPLAGFAARTSPSTGTHDPLEVVAISVSEPDCQVASVILVADLVAVGCEESRSICRAVAGSLNIEPAAVSFAVTHTHSAPFAAQVLGGCPEPGYLDQVAAAAVQAALQASGSMRPATMRYGSTIVEGVTFNRRGESSTDEVVRTVSFHDDSESLVGLIFCFACHPVVLGPDNTLVSADWPGVARRWLQERLRCPAIFLQGCCGDLNTGHKASESVLGSVSPRRTFPEAERVGVRVADAAALAVGAAYPVGGSTVSVAVSEVTLSGGPMSGDPDVVAPVSRHAWGELDVLLLPGEPFIQVANEIRARSGRSELLVGGYSGGVPGYLPFPPVVYLAGGYEVEEAHVFYGRASCFAPQAATLLVKVGIELVSQASATNEGW